MDGAATDHIEGSNIIHSQYETNLATRTQIRCDIAIRKKNNSRKGNHEAVSYSKHFSIKTYTSITLANSCDGIKSIKNLTISFPPESNQKNLIRKSKSNKTLIFSHLSQLPRKTIVLGDLHLEINEYILCHDSEVPNLHPFAHALSIHSLFRQNS